MVGHFLESAPDIAKRMVADGHTVGNHTYHHPDMSSISDLASFQKEVDDVAVLFKETTGQEMAKFYRPPQGKYSTENLKMAKELGYSTFFWSLAYVDWNVDAQPTKEEAFGKLLKRIHPGAVVLLHSTSKTNGEILDELLTKWEEMGYSFRPLSDLAGMGTKGGADPSTENKAGTIKGTEAEAQSTMGRTPETDSTMKETAGRTPETESRTKETAGQTPETESRTGETGQSSTELQFKKSSDQTTKKENKTQSTEEQK